MMCLGSQHPRKRTQSQGCRSPRTLGPRRLPCAHPALHAAASHPRSPAAALQHGSVAASPRCAPAACMWLGACDLHLAAPSCKVGAPCMGLLAPDAAHGVIACATHSRRYAVQAWLCAPGARRTSPTLKPSARSLASSPSASLALASLANSWPSGWWLLDTGCWPRPGPTMRSLQSPWALNSTGAQGPVHWCARAAVLLQSLHAAGLSQLSQGRFAPVASLQHTLTLPSDACTVMPMTSARSTPRSVQSTVNFLGSGFLCKVLRKQTTTHCGQLVLGFD